MGEVGRAKDRVLDCLPSDVVLTEQLDDALTMLYALGERHGGADAEHLWLERTTLLRHLARAATVFVSADDVDTAYKNFKDTLDQWWECEN